MPALCFGISADALLTVIKGAILVVDGAAIQRPFRRDWPVTAIDESSADGAMRLAEFPGTLEQPISRSASRKERRP